MNPNPPPCPTDTVMPNDCLRSRDVSGVKVTMIDEAILPLECHMRYAVDWGCSKVVTGEQL